MKTYEQWVEESGIISSEEVWEAWSYQQEIIDKLKERLNESKK